MKTKNSQTRTIVLTLIGFVIYLLLHKSCFSEIKKFLDEYTRLGLLSYIITYALIGIPIIVATYLINTDTNIWKNLGFQVSISKAFLVSLIFAFPMLAGGIMINGLASGLNWQNLVAGTIVAGFVEELYFRGFLFGMLHKYTRLGFLSAVVLGALLFASAHLYQSQDPLEMLGIFGITFMGAGLFAWLYAEWDYNLWVPIFLHTFMNLAWSISDMGNTALGGWLPNVLRVTTITLSIVGTIIWKRKKGQPMKITKDNLFHKTLIG